MTAPDLPMLAAADLRVVLDSVDAAITVRARDGGMLYANDAAAHILCLPNAASVVGRRPDEVMALFDVYTETGQRLSLEDMPFAFAMAGDPAPQAMIVRTVVRATGEERWLINKARSVLDDAGEVTLVINLFEDITDTKRAEIAQRLLAEAARQVAELEDPADAFQVLADAAVPDLADWAGVDVVDGSGRVIPAAIAHTDPEKVRLGWRLRTDWPLDPSEETGMAAVIRTGRPQLIQEVTDEMLVAGAHDAEHLAVLRAVGLNSTMIAPVQAGERVLGALSFVSSTSRRFDERDLELALDLGRQVGVLIHGAQLRAEQARIAHTLQAGLIPQSLPRFAGWRLTSAYRAAGRANEVGGDFYDVVRGPTGWAAIIGDVLGKGAAAASLTALARHTVAAIVESTGDVAHALAVLNRRLRERGQEYRSLCTLAVVEVRSGPGDTAGLEATSGSEVTVYSAGHPLPLLVGSGGVREIGNPSAMLGFIDELEVEPTRVPIAPGEMVVLSTDGVLDAMGVAGRLGEKGFAETVGRVGPHGSAEDLLAEIDRFRSGEQTDDIAIVGLERLPTM